MAMDRQVAGFRVRAGGGNASLVTTGPHTNIG